MPLVECRNGVQAVLVGEHHQRCIGQAERQVAISLDDEERSHEIGRIESSDLGIAQPSLNNGVVGRASRRTSALRTSATPEQRAPAAARSSRSLSSLGR